MGCRLPKLRKAEERRSPGNIYSTLRRPQVETKVGVAYTYHFLDFLLGKEEVPVSSVLCLSSVRELPVQVRELYAQGFVLVAVHPFVHPCGPSHARIQRQLHRAVLVRETPSSEKNQLRWGRHRLETDVCVAGHQVADPELIQSYVKRIQDVAEQGVMFVGFLQQPGGGPCFVGHWDPEELSSLHSSPSPIHRHPLSASNSPTDPSEPEPQEMGLAGAETNAGPLKPKREESAQKRSHLPDLKQSTENRLNLSNQRDGQSSSSGSWPSSPELDGNREKGFCNTNGKSRPTAHDNNNHVRVKSSEKDENAASPPAQGGMQLFALYNHTGEMNASLRFYSLRVPLLVQREAGLITDVDTHWLDHMTQHFTSGAHLVDGFFHLREEMDNGVSSVDSVFIFQSAAEETTSASYDAIVVEQWTVVDGVVVKTDYIPLLQSLAPYGWRLMCVLPTPIVKTNGDGSLSTKQILFLQRPVLQRKRKDFKMRNLRGRSKAKRDTPEDRENMYPLMDRLRRNSKDEEEEEEEQEQEKEAEGRKSRDSERSEGAGLQRGFSPLSGSGASLEEEEEETDIDNIPPPRLGKPQRWTDVCQRVDGGVKEELKTEERIKQQLFSGVC
ncbi:raftlin [Pungitius pungitius]|uniref:raftlin n=1 Tax=Pungitius pungitius TaxID=134920 RepID=UPI002E0E4BA6